MSEVDRRMEDDLGIDLSRMIEHAGRALALVARDVHLGGDARGRRVLAVAGGGGNGGGALVAARRLHGWGAEVSVVAVADPARTGAVTAHQRAILERSGVPVVPRPTVPAGTELLLDGLIGYGLTGAPTGRVADAIAAVAAATCPVVSLDVPSGIDGTSGNAPGPHVTADTTVTLALVKTGLLTAHGRRAAGTLLLADIGVPPSLYAAMGRPDAAVPFFGRADVVVVPDA
jgi:NAD(P)H-hydrate epimerase